MLVAIAQAHSKIVSTEEFESTEQHELVIKLTRISRRKKKTSKKRCIKMNFSKVSYFFVVVPSFYITTLYVCFSLCVSVFLALSSSSVTFELIICAHIWRVCADLFIDNFRNDDDDVDVECENDGTNGMVRW